MSAIAPASAQAPGPTPPSAHPAHEVRGHLAFAGVLDGLSHSPAKAATSEGASLAARSPDEERRQAPPAPQSELRTGSIDAALSSLFAAPLNAAAGERPEPVVHVRQPEQVGANPAAAETNRSSSHAPGAAIEQATSARLIAERSFVLPAMADGKITAPGSGAIGGGAYPPAAKAPAAADASVTFPTVAPSATPSSGRPPVEADAMQAALPPATLKGQDSGAAASLDGPFESRPPGSGPSAGSAGAAAMRSGAGNSGRTEPASGADPAPTQRWSSASGEAPASGGGLDGSSPTAEAPPAPAWSPSAPSIRPGAGNDAPLIPAPVAELTAGHSSSAGDHVLPAPASRADPNADRSAARGETKGSGDATNGGPQTAGRLSTKRPAPAGGSELRLASHGGATVSPAGAGSPVEPGRRQNDPVGPAFGDDPPPASPSAPSFGPAVVPMALPAWDAQSGRVGEAVPTPSAAPAAGPQAKAPVREIDLDLSPGGLEDVTMTMRLAGDRLSVVIRAASSQTAGAVEGAREAIAERLAAIGQPLGSLVIQRTVTGDGTGKAAEPQGDDGGAPAQRQDAGDPRGNPRRGSSGF